MSFRICRKQAGLTQAQVAAAVGVVPSSVSLWEHGKFMPTVRRLRKLAELYGVTADELLSEEVGACDCRGGHRAESREPNRSSGAARKRTGGGKRSRGGPVPAAAAKRTEGRA